LEVIAWWNNSSELGPVPAPCEYVLLIGSIYNNVSEGLSFEETTVKRLYERVA